MGSFFKKSIEKNQKVILLKKYPDQKISLSILNSNFKC